MFRHFGTIIFIGATLSACAMLQPAPYHTVTDISQIQGDWLIETVEGKNLQRERAVARFRVTDGGFVASLGCNGISLPGRVTRSGVFISSEEIDSMMTAKGCWHKWTENKETDLYNLFQNQPVITISNASNMRISDGVTVVEARK